MVVQTYPEGGSHALKVCQHHHQVCESATLSGCQRLKEHVARDFTAADSAETFTVPQRTARSKVP
jgi:hypothetical protein